MKNVKRILYSVLVSILVSGAMSHAATAQAPMTKTSGGIIATLKIDAKGSMVDLYLTDAKTRKPITGGVAVTATVTKPDKKKVKIELKGMEMDGAFSYMNTLDMPIKGIYTVVVAVESGGKETKFDFAYEVK